jgi:hypothetical protein
MFDILTLPFRLVFGILCSLLALPFALLAIPFALLYLPFLVLRFLVKAIVALVMLPFVLFAAIIGIGLALVAISVFLILPLVLPIAFVLFCLWIAARLAAPVVV